MIHTINLLYFLCFFFALTCVHPLLHGQNYCDVRYDYIWIMGGIDQDTISDDKYGGCEINFNTSPTSFHLNYKPVRSPFQNASMCDKDGELIFYSNGCVVLNVLDEVMENGDTLNPGENYNEDCPLYGYVGYQNMIGLPDLYQDHLYYLFHVDLIYNREPGAPFLLQPAHIYCTTIDMNQEDGLGRVIEKNKVIVSDTGILWSPLSAAKHANGLDWWILLPDRWSNSFHTILVSNGNSNYVNKQFVGIPPDPRSTAGQGKFSPDGTKFAWYHPLNGLFLYDFDREIGELYNFEKIEIPFLQGTAGGCEFSPSGRFVYVNNYFSLYQVDVRAANISESLTHIADYDGFRDPLPTSFYLMERTPDHRIIMNIRNGSQWLHVIQEPNKKGAACRFEQHIIKLPTVNNFTLPHFPNYRLGPLGEPLCDSMTVSVPYPKHNSKETYILMPNPASDHFQLEPTSPELPRDVEIILSSVTGSILLSTKGLWVDTNTLAPGLYFVSIRYKGHLIQQSRVIISGR